MRELENVDRAGAGVRRGRRASTWPTCRRAPCAARRARAQRPAACRTARCSLPEILEDLERQLIQRAYEKASGVKTETARLLGIKTSALYYKLEKYGIGVIESRGDKLAPPPEQELLDDGPVAGGVAGRRQP